MDFAVGIAVVGTAALTGGEDSSSVRGSEDTVESRESSERGGIDSLDGWRKVRSRFAKRRGRQRVGEL